MNYARVAAALVVESKTKNMRTSAIVPEHPTVDPDQSRADASKALWFAAVNTCVLRKDGRKVGQIVLSRPLCAVVQPNACVTLVCLSSLNSEGTWNLSSSSARLRILGPQSNSGTILRRMVAVSGGNGYRIGMKPGG
jgi:hypothetical protein